MSPFPALHSSVFSQQPPRVLLVFPPGADPGRLPFAEMVRDQGLPYSVEIANTICDALQQLKQGCCDVILSHYQIGDATVFSILERARRGSVIVVSDKDDTRTAVEVFKAGAADYILEQPDGGHLELLPQAVESAMKAKALITQFQTLTHAMMSINDSVFITDMDDTVIYVNKAFCSTYGHTEQEVLGQHVSIIWHQASGNAWSPAKELAQEGLQKTHDLLNCRKDGSVFPISLSRSVVQDDEGTAFAVVGVARDVTARVEAERELKESLSEKEVLLREIHHRVKNNLQIISSLLNLQSGFLQDPQTITALRESQNRVRSMALIHERIYQSGLLSKIDFPAYVRSLADHLLSTSHSRANVTIEVEQPELLIEVEMAVPCGLIVNELLSNSLEHAFKGRDSGRINVAFPVETYHGQPTLSLDVQDDGVGYPTGMDLENTTSLGLQLINMLSQQLKGSLTLLHKKGARTLVRMPLPPLCHIERHEKGSTLEHSLNHR